MLQIEIQANSSLLAGEKKEKRKRNQDVDCFDVLHPNHLGYSPFKKGLWLIRARDTQIIFSIGDCDNTLFVLELAEFLKFIEKKNSSKPCIYIDHSLVVNSWEIIFCKNIIIIKKNNACFSDVSGPAPLSTRLFFLN